MVTYPTEKRRRMTVATRNPNGAPTPPNWIVKGMKPDTTLIGAEKARTVTIRDTVPIRPESLETAADGVLSETVLGSGRPIVEKL
jgi:hypothetical protein